MKQIYNKKPIMAFVRILSFCIAFVMCISSVSFAKSYTSDGAVVQTNGKNATVTVNLTNIDGYDEIMLFAVAQSKTTSVINTIQTDKKSVGEDKAVTLTATVEINDDEQLKYYVLDQTGASLNNTAPTAPSNLTASATMNSATISWEHSKDDNGKVEYVIYNGNNEVGRTSNPTYTINDLVKNKNYTFTVEPVDKMGEKGAVAKIEVQPVDPDAQITYMMKMDFEGYAEGTNVNAIASSFASDSGYAISAGKITAGTDSSSKFTIQKNPDDVNDEVLDVHAVNANPSLGADQKISMPSWWHAGEYQVVGAKVKFDANCTGKYIISTAGQGGNASGGSWTNTFTQVMVTPDGFFTANGITQLGTAKPPKGEWFDLKFVFNNSTGKYNICVNNQVVARELANVTGYTKFMVFKNIDITVTKGSSNSHMYVNDLYMGAISKEGFSALNTTPVESLDPSEPSDPSDPDEPIVPDEPSEKHNIVIASDSIAAEYKSGSIVGWGMEFKNHLTGNATLVNLANPGSSTKTFPNKQQMIDSLSNGDIALICFGHNDSMTDSRGVPLDEYKVNLKDYIDSVKAKGAIPVILTSIPQYNAGGSIVYNKTDGITPYRDAALEVAAANNVQSIDAARIVYTTFMAECAEDADATKAKFALMYADEGYANRTHLTKSGAAFLAQIIAKNLYNNPNIAGIQNLIKYDASFDSQDPVLPEGPVDPDSALANLVKVDFEGYDVGTNAANVTHSFASSGGYALPAGKITAGDIFKVAVNPDDSQDKVLDVYAASALSADQTMSMNSWWHAGKYSVINAKVKFAGTKGKYVISTYGRGANAAGNTWSGVFSTTMITPDGVFTGDGNTQIGTCKLPINEWFDLKIVFDAAAGKYGVYVNNQYVAKGLSNNTGFAAVQVFTNVSVIAKTDSAAGSHMYLDDINVSTITDEGYAVINETAYVNDRQDEGEDPVVPPVDPEDPDEPVVPEQPEDPEVNVDEYLSYMMIMDYEGYSAGTAMSSVASSYHTTQTDYGVASGKMTSGNAFKIAVDNEDSDNEVMAVSVDSTLSADDTLSIPGWWHGQQPYHLISAKIKFNSENNGKYIIKTSGEGQNATGGKWTSGFTTTTITPNGIYAGDGVTQLCDQKLPVDEWFDLKILFDSTKGKYDVYINNKYAVKDAGLDTGFLKFNVFKNVSIIVSKDTQAGSIMYVDDLFFGKISQDGYTVLNENEYSYSEPSTPPAQPEEPEQPEVPEVPDVNVDEHVASIMEIDFEGYAEGTAMSSVASSYHKSGSDYGISAGGMTAGDAFKVAVDPEDSDNEVMAVSVGSTLSADDTLAIVGSGWWHAQSPYHVISAKIKFNSENNGKYLITTYGQGGNASGGKWSGNFSSIMFTPDGIYTGDGATQLCDQKLPVGEWFDLKLVFNVDTGKYDVYVNNKCAAKDLDNLTGFPKFLVFRNVSVIVSKDTAANSVMYVDDLWFGNITEEGYAAMNEYAYEE